MTVTPTDEVRTFFKDYFTNPLYKSLIRTENLQRGMCVVIAFNADRTPARIGTVKRVFEIDDGVFSIDWQEGGRSHAGGHIEWSRYDIPERTTAA